MKIKANQYEYIDGKRYGLASIPLHKTKTSATQRADRYRKAGFNARIIKIDAGKYAVYTRKK
jgi:hypothetical protein